MAALSAARCPRHGAKITGEIQALFAGRIRAGAGIENRRDGLFSTEAGLRCSAIMLWHGSEESVSGPYLRACGAACAASLGRTGARPGVAGGPLLIGSQSQRAGAGCALIGNKEHNMNAHVPSSRFPRRSAAHRLGETLAVVRIEPPAFAYPLANKRAIGRRRQRGPATVAAGVAQPVRGDDVGSRVRPAILPRLEVLGGRP